MEKQGPPHLAAGQLGEKGIEGIGEGGLPCYAVGHPCGLPYFLSRLSVTRRWLLLQLRGVPLRSLEVGPSMSFPNLLSTPGALIRAKSRGKVPTLRTCTAA